MPGNIIWKLVLSVFIAFWAYTSLTPLEDTPFEDYIEQRATADKEQFDKILEEAEALIGSGEDQPSTLYLALRQYANEKKIDLKQFFPDINLVQTQNVKKSNEILMRVLLKESRGELKLGLDLKGGVAFTLQVPPPELPEPEIDPETGEVVEQESFEEVFQQERLDKAIDIMGRRVDGLGVSEPIIRAKGSNQIEIQLPGLSLKEDPDAINKLKAPALLEFRKVHRTQRPAPMPENWDSLNELEQQRVLDQQKPPPGYELLIQETEDRKTGEITETPLFVEIIPRATGDIIDEAGYSIDEMGNYFVTMDFSSEGGDIFADITRAFAREGNPSEPSRLAIVLDGKLYSSPTVTKEISGGAAIIEGSFTQLEAFELANVLNNPLEFELELVEMSEVGPTLARDALDASVKAAILGAALVVGFMVVYYLGAGVVAMISTALNLFIVVGVLAFLDATMTLPGVAALVLTIGMGVDANILIFERIREELNMGKKLETALVNGFDKAFSTIVDANVTTLITAVILIYLGTGPVKGFGITLAIGIFSTVFAALIVSRMLLELVVHYKIAKKLLHYSLFKESKIEFHKYQKAAFIASWMIVIAGIVVFKQEGDEAFGIDFKGGEEITMDYTKEIDVTAIHELADDEGLGEVVPVYQTILGDTDKNVLKVRTESEQGDPVFAALEEAFPEAELSLLGKQVISPSVSDTIKHNAIISVVVALVGILLYVAIRFEVGFAIGAVVATIHDVLMTIGIYVMLDGQFTAPMIAAILMIVGYSINDTIVVFDRIREELQLNPETKLRDVINLAINRTLGRTVLTSITTLLAAVSLFVYAAGVVNDYALVFIIGICTGTFSSIFIASPVFFWWHKGDRRHVEERELVPKHDWETGAAKKA